MRKGEGGEACDGSSCLLPNLPSEISCHWSPASPRHHVGLCRVMGHRTDCVLKARDEPLSTCFLTYLNGEERNSKGSTQRKAMSPPSDQRAPRRKHLLTPKALSTWVSLDVLLPVPGLSFPPHQPGKLILTDGDLLQMLSSWLPLVHTSIRPLKL